MISELSVSNFGVWIGQVFMITSIGALLPLVFRIHHPRSILIYYRLLLVAALLLPLFQPVQHEIVLVRDGQLPSTVSAAGSTQATPTQDPAGTNWRDLLLGLFVAGFVVRIAWLTGGLWQLRRLRRSSTPLHPVSTAVQSAATITRTDALFCVSRTIKGPVTFGFLRPVILLPNAFLEMPAEAQSSVACHELLHVRRNDWLLTMLEELVASVLWFQPAVWWLVAQSRLAREQLVDAAVVSLTASRDSYIKTLFSLADARWEADLGVASLFLRRRHLIHRVHSLLTEVSMSRTRLVSSYCSIAAILAIGGALMFVALPLTGEAEIRHVAAEEQPAAAQNTPGYVVNRSPTSYPAEARQKGIEGTVVVELAFNARGEIVDARVLSGPEELRQAGLQTALQGKYPIDIARTLQVVIDFKLPAPGQRGPAPRSQASGPTGEAGTFAELRGAVTDSSGNLVPGVMITASNDQEGRRVVRAVILTDEKGQYEFRNMPAGTYRLSAQLPDFQTVTYNTVPLGVSQQVRLNFTLQPAAGAGRGGAPTPPAPIQTADGGTSPRVRVGKNVMARNLIAQVKPVYPPQARESQIRGVVDLEVHISKEGRVETARVINGDPVFNQPAIDSVMQWIYKPVLLNGQPVDVVTTITVNIP